MVVEGLFLLFFTAFFFTLLNGFYYVFNLAKHFAEMVHLYLCQPTLSAAVLCHTSCVIARPVANYLLFNVSKVHDIIFGYFKRKLKAHSFCLHSPFSFSNCRLFAAFCRRILKPKSSLGCRERRIRPQCRCWTT